MPLMDDTKTRVMRGIGESRFGFVCPECGETTTFNLDPGMTSYGECFVRIRCSKCGYNEVFTQ